MAGLGEFWVGSMVCDPTNCATLPPPPPLLKAVMGWLAHEVQAVKKYIKKVVD